MSREIIEHGKATAVLKKRSAGRIDGAITLTMAVGAAPSVWRGRSILPR